MSFTSGLESTKEAVGDIRIFDVSSGISVIKTETGQELYAILYRLCNVNVASVQSFNLGIDRK